MMLKAAGLLTHRTAVVVKVRRNVATQAARLQPHTRITRTFPHGSGTRKSAWCRAVADVLPPPAAPPPSTVNPQALNNPGVLATWASRAADFDASLPTGLAVTWLGTSSGRPTINRNVSCTVVRMPGTLLIVDCGEGSVRQLESTGLDLKTVDRIFITHLHGDHVFGLPGLLRRLSAYKALLPPEQRHLNVYGPPGLVDFVRVSLAMQDGPLAMQLTVTEFVSSQQAHLDPQPMEGLDNVFSCQQGPDIAPHVPQLKSIHAVAGDKYAPLLTMFSRRRRLNPRAFDQVNMQPQGNQAWYVRCSNGALVGAAQLLHRVPCWGYAMYEPAQAPGQPPRKVVVLGDTMNSSAIASLAWGADVLSHEATFAAGMEKKAYEALHSTAWMAGLFAKSVRARQLVLTHFSSRYEQEGESNRFSSGESSRFSSRESNRFSSGESNRFSSGESSSDEEEGVASCTNADIELLLNEARDAFGKSRVCAASDFFTFHVPPAASAPPLQQA